MNGWLRASLGCMRRAGSKARHLSNKSMKDDIILLSSSFSFAEAGGIRRVRRSRDAFDMWTFLITSCSWSAAIVLKRWHEKKYLQIPSPCLCPHSEIHPFHQSTNRQTWLSWSSWYWIFPWPPSLKEASGYLNDLGKVFFLCRAHREYNPWTRYQGPCRTVHQELPTMRWWTFWRHLIHRLTDFGCSIEPAD